MGKTHFPHKKVSLKWEKSLFGHLSFPTHPSSPSSPLFSSLFSLDNQINLGLWISLIFFFLCSYISFPHQNPRTKQSVNILCNFIFFKILFWWTKYMHISLVIIIISVHVPEFKAIGQIHTYWHEWHSTPEPKST